jgi:ethanolamine utilization protein EutA
VLREAFISVGIDIGTTTMSMAVSRLKLENSAPGLGIPRVRITGKEVLFRSDTEYTPFSEWGEIQVAAVERFVFEQFERAGVDPSMIRTGAVIVTGQAAQAANAEAVGRAVSRVSGQFVVAVAGAHLEAAISGRGAGASRLSESGRCRVLNLDIGGGTTNASLFENGRLSGTFCFEIGGRLVRFVPGTKTVARFTKTAEHAASRVGVALEKGRPLTEGEIGKTAEVLAGSLVSFIRGAPDDLALESRIEPGLKLLPGEVDRVTFSGGVGRLLYEEEKDDRLRYGDFGPFLADSLRGLIGAAGIKVGRPDETMFATVIGAGVHTVSISGSTIYLSNPSDLPIRDLPVVSIAGWGSPQVRTVLRTQLEMFGRETGRLPALFCGRMEQNGFREAKRLAEEIADLVEGLTVGGPLVVVLEDDIGKIMGGLLRNRVGQDRSLFSIDQLGMGEMDYVDIGTPLFGGTVVPVIVKTLVFPGAEPVA